ncbi:hypothetical protein LTS18_014769, partial [Coniosporium uncinatum]
MLTVALAISPPEPPTGLMLKESEHLVKTSIAQISMRSFHVQLDWDLVGLAEGILKLLQEHELFRRQPGGVIGEIARQQNPPEPVVESFQIVLALGSGVIGIDTINVSNVNVCESLKLSLIGFDKTSADEGISVTALLHAQNIHTAIRSESKLLLRLESDQPNLYISHADEPSRAERWRLGGSTKNVAIDVREEILGMIGVADSILRDEVAYIQAQIVPYVDFGSPQSQEVTRTPSKSLPKITLALIMESYSVDVALVQSLTYSLSGQVGRLSAIPDLNKKLAFNLDYDLGTQVHSLNTVADDEIQSISDFGLPRVNGRLSIDQKGRQLTVDVNTSIETIKIEADAFHGIMTTFQRPELMDAFKAIKDDIEILQERVKDIFPEKVQRVASNES